MADFCHRLISGPSGCGKTTLAVALVKDILRRMQRVIVFTTADVRSWPKHKNLTLVFDSLDKLERTLRDPRHFGSFVVFDEAIDIFEDGNPRKHKNVFSLHRTGRHKGYTAIYVTQDLIQIPPKVRRNCKKLYCFGVGSDQYSAAKIQRDFPSLSLKKREALAESILKLKRYEFLTLENGRVRLCKL